MGMTPTQWLLLQPPGLALPEGGAGFHQHQLQPLAPLGARLGEEDAQVMAQAAISRSPLHQAEGIGCGGQCIETLEHLGQQQGGQGGPHAGGRHKIPPPPKCCLTGTVIAVFRILEYPLHIGGEGHSPAGGLKALLQPGGARAVG